MQIELNNTGKRFNREWIFRNCNYTFNSGISYAITGPNGSGKSTLLQTIAGAINASEGSITVYREQPTVDRLPLTEEGSLLAVNGQRSTVNGIRSTVNGQRSTVDNASLYQHLSIAAPYLELVEEMTATEALKFHAAFKPLLDNISIQEILTIVGLKDAANKQIRYYSSGMKQRMKLAQAIFSDAPILLLDEPCTNLDAVGYELYHQLIKDYCSNKLVIVCSNDPHEYDFCKERIDIMAYKPGSK
jgi:ABC-type multidrug transport system ATPase subunit